MYKNQLNEHSQQLVRNVYNNFRVHPTYAKYNVEMSGYDAMKGSITINISLNNQLVNRFDFYGTPFGGRIGSIAIYGANLNGHLNSIRGSMTVFGLVVEDISIDNAGFSPYVDVQLKPY